MAVSVTDSATPAHDGIGVSGRDKVPCSWLVGLPAAPAEDCVKGHRSISCFRDSRRSVGNLEIVAISEVDLSFSTPCVANLRRED